MNSGSEVDFYYPKKRERFKGNHEINTFAIWLETFPRKSKYELGRTQVLGPSFPLTGLLRLLNNVSSKSCKNGNCFFPYFFQVIAKYLENTHAETHNQYHMELLDVFELDRGKKSFTDVGNR